MYTGVHSFDTQIEHWAKVHPVSTDQMVLQPDWSPPLVNSVDGTWFAKVHTCLYKGP